MTFTDYSGNETVRHVHVSDFPNLWIMPVFECPGILLNVKPEETRFGILHTNEGDQAAYQKLLRLPGVKSVSATSGGAENWIFARWIAKIGYCYAVALFGLANVKSSPLVDMIRHGSKFPNYLVGGLNKLNLSVSQEFTLEPPTNEIFRVRMMDVTAADGKTYMAVYVRLLPMLQAATYIAVIGEKIQDSHSLYQNALDYERVQLALPSR
jgi:hypothetical protein